MFPGRDYQLRAEDTIDKQKWIAALEEAVNYAQQKEKSIS